MIVKTTNLFYERRRLSELKYLYGNPTAGYEQPMSLLPDPPVLFRNTDGYCIVYDGHTIPVGGVISEHIRMEKIKKASLNICKVGCQS